MTVIMEQKNCISLQKSFLNFLHSSHALRCVAAYLYLCYQNQTKIDLHGSLLCSVSHPLG